MTWFKKMLIAFAICTISTICILVIWLFNTFPQTTGEVLIDGLKSPVTVYRDKRSILHIYAKNLNYVYQAIGFTHSQGRFAQMELMLRHGNGRLAEVVGPRALLSDQYMRTLGLKRLVKVQL